MTVDVQIQSPRLNQFNISVQYAFILFLVFMVELAVVCVSFTTDASVVMKHVSIPVEYYTTDTEVQAEMDYMQLSVCARCFV